LSKLMPILDPLLKFIFLFIGGTILSQVIFLLGVISVAFAPAIIILEELKLLWDVVLSPILTKVYEVLSTIWGYIKDALEPIWNEVVGVLTKVYNFAMSILQPIFDGVKTRLENLYNWFVGVGKGIWEGVSSFCEKIWGGVSDTYKWFVNTMKPVWDTIKSAISSLWNWFSPIASTIWTKILEAIEKIFPNGKFLGIFAEGGFTGKTGGLAMLHPNEWILNEKQMNNIMSNSMGNSMGTSEQSINVGGVSITINGGVGGLTTKQITESVEGAIASAVRRRRVR
jgi:phage-related protein